jgi:hypothetical protein
MVDRDHNKIGEVVDIYLDNDTDRPEWAVVRTGLFGLRSSFVPLAEAREVGDELQVPHQRSQVKQAPNIEPDGQLSAAEEAELYRHYGLDYDSVTLDSGAPADRTNEPEGIDTGATAAGGPEPASTATGGLADTGTDAQTGTRAADEAGGPGLDRGPDSSLIESEPGRGDGRAGLAATAGGEPVAPAGHDQLPVGEGVSRPFVYETPGRPAGGAGIRRRQPGQVRLRRYLVTEVVTETEAGQRHEVRVQREPVSDAEVDAAGPAPDQQDEPIGRNPNGPEPNDWFNDQSDRR